MSRTQAHVDAAVEALVLGDAAALQAHERRLDAAAAARADAARHVEAVQDAGLRALVFDLVFDSSASQCAEALPGARPDKLLKFPCRTDDADDESESESESESDSDADADADACSGCGETGHAHADCPHRSDVSDDDDVISSDGDD